MSGYINNDTIAFGSFPPKTYTAQAAEHARELSKIATTLAKVDAERPNPRLTFYRGNKILGERVDYANHYANHSVIPSPGPNVLDNRPAGPNNFKTTQDETAFPSLSSVKATTSISSAQPINLKALQKSLQPIKLTCPLDHIFGKKKPDPKLSKDKKSPAKDDEKNEVSAPDHTSKCPPSSAEGTVSIDSAQTKAPGSLEKNCRPVKLTRPPNCRFGKRPAPKLPVIKSLSLEDRKKIQVSSNRPTTYHQPSTIQELDVMFPSLPSVKTAVHNKNQTNATKKNVAGEGKRLQSISVPKEITSTKSLAVTPQVQSSFVVKEPTVSKCISTKPKALEVKDRVKSNDTNKGCVPAELAIAKELPPISKPTTDRPTITDSPSKILTTLEPTKSEPPSNVLEERRLSLKDFAKQQKVLRKASQQAKRSAKLEQEMVDREVCKQEASLAAEQAVVKAATQQHVLKDLLGQTKGVEEFGEADSKRQILDVLCNTTIAKEGSDPMAFIGSRSEDDMELEYPRSDIPSTFTESQIGIDPMAWIWNRNSVDFENDYPRPSADILTAKDQPLTSTNIYAPPALHPSDTEKASMIATVTNNTVDFKSPKLVIVQNEPKNQPFDAAGSIQTSTLCKEEAFFRNVSDSSAGTMASATNTGFNETSPISPISPISPLTTEREPSDRVFSKKGSQTILSPSIQTTTIPTDVLTRLLSTLLRVEAKVDTLEAKVNGLESKINAMAAAKTSCAACTANTS